ncbi:cell wall hydrolase [Qipengyuania vesicularis]|uniref:cell wall hydrolase n=1 Tax=Qipengyuania vesicularis TaxID=2867232 RepID=UPI001FFD4588|nr:cell wall hydrolase [Qipengyuania vesicularis]
MRKFTIAIAASAAAMVATFAGAEETGAQAAIAAEETTAEETVLTEEVVPVFVSNEVVQELPEEATDEFTGNVEARSLRELVATIAAPDELSDEMRCLAGAVYFESRGEPLAGQLAVAQVVINRSESNRFPASYCGVVYQRAQFSFVRGGTMPRIKTGSAAWERATKIARIAHQGLWESEAQDSLYFHATYVSPRWASKKTRRAAIKTHIFYR